MEIAGYLRARVEELRRDVLFICFSAEEMGLLGSRHYVDAPIFPLEKTAAMVNLDMVSYLGNTGSLEVYGTGTAPTFKALLQVVNRESRIKIKEIEGVGRGASDHYPFYQKGLPVMFFITGLHKRYHRPTDDWKYMDKRGFEKVVQFAGDIAFDLAAVKDRPIFTPTTEGGLESGPYLGVILENREDGVYVSQVARGSPADRGGLREDDRLVELNDNEIDTLALFYGMWAGVSPGDRVSFQVRRSGRLRTVRIRL
jgi:Zn-dependent M28 family amino/carboxypeptidase